MASQGWRMVQAHVPMIRFRKASIERAAGAAAATSQSAGAVPSSEKVAKWSPGPGVVARPTIEDFQLPARYARRPIDLKEIDYINRGGPE